MIEIKNKITSVSVVNDKAGSIQKQTILERPETLSGKTYKLSIPDDLTLYITINDYIENGKSKPFEIFINSKNMENFQWVVALTRVISGVMRQNDDIGFLIDELKSVFNPLGGYWKNGSYIPSIIAGIGLCIEKHINGCSEVTNKQLTKQSICPKCNQKFLIKTDGCDSCINCGYSKCS